MRAWRGSSSYRGTASRVMRGTRDEKVLEAELVLLSDAAEGEDLIALACALDLGVEWGETAASLRTRIRHRGRYFYRAIAPAGPIPAYKLLARVVRALPVGRDAVRGLLIRLGF